MILPDVNTLLYAVNSASHQHRLALVALQEGFAGPRGVGFTWVVLLAFLRLSTRNGIFPKPLSVDDALAVVERWLDHPQSQMVNPGEQHYEILARLLQGAGVAGNLTTDAHLAAVAIEQDATLLSFDRDFARFEGLRWALPKASKR
jgi:uncharacterized protein